MNSSTVGVVVFAIYAIVLFALLAPNVLIQLPKKYSDMSRILIHGSIFLVTLVLSYLVWSLVQIPQPSVSPPSAVMSSSLSTIIPLSSSSSSTGPTVIYSTAAANAVPTYNNNSVVVPPSRMNNNPNAVKYPNSSYPSMSPSPSRSPSPSTMPIETQRDEGSKPYKAFDYTYNSGYSTYSDPASRHYKEDHQKAAAPAPVQAKPLVPAPAPVQAKPLVPAPAPVQAKPLVHAPAPVKAKPLVPAPAPVKAKPLPSSTKAP
jgi:hypothetical protein